MRYAKRLTAVSLVLAMVASTPCFTGCLSGDEQPPAEAPEPSEAGVSQPSASESAPPEPPSSPPPSTPRQLAVVSQVFREVLVMRAGTDTWSNATANMTLEAGDRIRTGAFSHAVVIFFEGSTIDLKADTEISVTELNVAEDTGSTVIRLWQEIGKTTSRVEKLIDPASRYEIETPAGAAVVRGSEADVTVAEDGTTTIDNIEGQWSAIAQEQEVPVPEGRRVTIVPGRPPSDPALSIDPGDLQDVGGGGGSGGGDGGSGGGQGR